MDPRSHEYVESYKITEDPIQSQLAAAANPDALYIRSYSAKSDADLVIEAGIDFAIDPAFVHGDKSEEVERQIEKAMLDLIKEPIDTTNKKLDHFWEENFGKVSLFWAISFIVPFYITADSFTIVITELLHVLLLEYMPFIILLLAYTLIYLFIIQIYYILNLLLSK